MDTEDDFDEERDEQDADEVKIRQQAALIEPTRELYQAARRFGYAAQQRQAGKALHSGKIPREISIGTYQTFVEEIRWMKTADPEKLLTLVEMWQNGHAETVRDMEQSFPALAAWVTQLGKRDDREV